MIFKTLAAAIVSVAVTSGVFAQTAPEAPSGAALYTYSTIDALLAGAYDGDATVGALKRRGNFGLGTFNRLDGELVAVDGVYYHVRADGSVTVAADTDRVPLAYVVPFKSERKLELDAAASGSLQKLEAALDQQLTNKNAFYAVQVRGTLADISARAIPAQSRPYVTLAEASKTQSVFKRDRIEGVMVGIRSPQFSKGISVPGWHWHVLSDDRQYGGHVLTASVIKGTAWVSSVNQMIVDVPSTADFAAADQSRDRTAELHQVETGGHRH